MNNEENYTEGYSEKDGEWITVEGKKMAKEKRAKIQEEIIAMKVGNNKEDTNNQSEADDVNLEELIHESRETDKEDSRYDTANEIEMEVDAENTQQVRSVVLSKTKVDNEARMAGSSQGAIKKPREEFMNRKGILERISELDATDIVDQKQVRFTEGSNVIYKIVLKLKREKTEIKREAINKLSDTIGITAEIDQRGSKYVGVITDWGESIPELWEAIDDHDNIEKIGRMYRKTWNKEDKQIVEEDTGNLIITFKGDTVRHRLDLFGRRTQIKVRPYIAAVKQCFKCFRFGHIKSACKSEERCIICGDMAHGNCTKSPKCRNCGGNHRSTYRACNVYEKNKSINVIMGYQNVSRREAERILTGKEQDKDQVYDRYEKTMEWPKLRPPRKEMEGKVSMPSTMEDAGRKIITVYEENRERRQQGRKEEHKKETCNTNKEENRNYKYYKQFNNRLGEITKDKRGIAYNNENRRQEDSWDCESSEEEIGVETAEEDRQDISGEIAAGFNGEQEIIMKLAAKLMYYTRQDWEFRRIVQEMIQGPEQKELGTTNQAEREKVKAEILKQQRELEMEEKRRKQRIIVGEIKKDFWKGRGRGMAREGDQTRSTSQRFPQI
ncbi:uncharacterized protein [Temnothorax nylanderi]|uniref:uncharacterized protein n=1 Tax=Temnothorax nylanderi TaxID=102681 RepID=UPI003A8B21AB